MTKEEIKEARGKLTQEEFAAKIDYSVDSVRSWEQGRKVPSRKAIRIIKRVIK